ncbi:uncharacterized protein [Epargyreus clarus]|uniref:uncharacterized protein n=1 Tax=Epargyreus clarus TaxID=520877 RepID=UPI003C2F9DE3
MAFLGNLTIFDHKTGEWSIFKGRLSQFIKINKVEEDNKCGILLTHLSDETYRLLRNLAYPEELDSQSYTNLVKLLDGHFRQKQASFVDKANFHGAMRGSGETLGEWVARLRGLASYCDFGAALETNLRDRFVLGLGPDPERDKLFEQNPATLTLSRAIELAEQVACVKEAKVMFSNNEVGVVKEEPIFRAGFQGQPSRGGLARRFDSGGSSVDIAGRRDQLGNGARCSVCGLKNHNSEKCRYKEYRCQRCGVKGHLKKVCGNVVKRSYINHIATDPDGEVTTDKPCEECQNFNLRYQTN